MNYTIKSMVLAMCLLGGNLFAQSKSLLQLTGPSSVSYCDLSGVTYNAVALGYVDDAFDDVDWRYKFSLWTNGVSVAEYTDNGVAAWTITTDDFAFVSGPYQVKLEVQYKWAFFWVTSETLWSNGINLTLFGNTGEYDALKTSYRMVSGDFDHDGREDDIAAFYHYGGTTTALHVWKSNGNTLAYQGDNGWWYGPSYDATKTTGRVVSGDFDRDGVKDDIAAFYDYGNNHTKMHVWTSNGSSFTYAGVWWQSASGGNGYNCNQIVGRVVSGDFDRDGYEDDICAFYDYGGSTTEAHVFQSSGSSFSSSGTWYASGSGNFTASKIQYRVVSGDFDRDGFNDDITAFYDYGNALTKAFVWRSTGSGFSSIGTWYDSGSGNFDGIKILGKVVSGDFDHDNFNDDIVAFYDDGNAQTRGFVWRSTGTTFSPIQTWYNSGPGNFEANNMNGKIVSGDFDHDGSNGDINGLYNYGNLSTRFFQWESTGSTFAWPFKTWEICNPSVGMVVSDNPVYDTSEQGNMRATVYPNPATGTFTVQSEPGIPTEIRVFNLNGQCIKTLVASENGRTETDLSDQTAGIYYIHILSADAPQVVKLVLQ